MKLLDSDDAVVPRCLPRESRRLPALPVLACAAALLATGMDAHAADAGRLAELINAYRQAPGRCAGKPRAAAGPLVPDSALERMRLASGSDLQQAFRQAGYQASLAEAIVVTGPRSDTAAMAAISDQYCGSLAKQEFTRVGVSRNGDTWQVILAKPLLAPDLGDPDAAGRKILTLVNAARARQRSCGGKHFPPAPALAWNAALARAAQAHSADMARHNYFRHSDRNGAQAGDRASRSGYAWRQVGENIAAGQGSAEDAVSGWLASPGHCANIMNREFREMGAWFVIEPRSDLQIYWTQVFGTPR
ncbi:CAP domain-containing protein [Noviherbaspirillum aerium]|uniref:CAP domain-containing protein n=1 Tax=Noviherbaspirillum aerium TaxID=2588497 RepID=UPI00124E91FB|nr:CAP domain-containing protein [Noviherbaspirillum aerium]